MAEAYLTRIQFAERMEVDLSEAPTNFELRLASDAVDQMGPFVGTKYDEDQERAFPRWSMPVYVGGEPPPVPERVLDAVALLAAFEASPEVSATVKSESTLDSSVTYETAVVPDAIRRVGTLLRLYQRTNGRVL